MKRLPRVFGVFMLCYVMFTLCIGLDYVCQFKWWKYQKHNAYLYIMKKYPTNTRLSAKNCKNMDKTSWVGLKLKQKKKPKIRSTSEFAEQLYHIHVEYEKLE